MEPFAMALPTMICYASGSLQVQIIFTVIGGDGNGGPLVLQVFFNWDNSVSAATNIASLKTTIVNQAASQNGTQVLSSNVSVLMAVN